METALILANRLIQIIRETGASKAEAYCALEVAHKILPSITDLPDNPPIPVSEDAAVG